jgi:1-phosphatidylinositol-4-phosphate 5-kinase
VPTLEAIRTSTSVPGVEGAALDSDILAEADKLRRERLERRQKQRQGSAGDEAAADIGSARKKSISGMSWRVDDGTGTAGPAGRLVGAAHAHVAGVSPTSQQGQSSVLQKQRRMSEKENLPGHVDQERVMVGNLIGEDHVNYVLMYNMLTGIRIGVSDTWYFCGSLATDTREFLQVSRCQAKVKRPLTDEDYTARHKFSFDMYVRVRACAYRRNLTHDCLGTASATS